MTNQSYWMPTAAESVVSPVKAMAVFCTMLTTCGGSAAIAAVPPESVIDAPLGSSTPLESTIGLRRVLGKPLGMV